MFRYDRLAQLFVETGKKKSYITSAIGRPKYYFNDCKKINKNLPDDEVRIIAAELGVSVEYLRGESNEKNPPAEEVERQKNIDFIMGALDDMSPVQLLELSEYIAKLAREKMK